MTHEDTTKSAETAGSTGGAGYRAALPVVRTLLSPVEVVARLDTASRRGRLPGFTRPGGEWLFSVECHGQPFDARLFASAAPVAAGGGELRFELRMRRVIPSVFAAMLLLTVWPGVYFMDQLIPGEWGLPTTWWWYVPLTALPIPWIWRGLMRKARKSNREAAEKAIGVIAREVEGTVA